MAPFAEFTLSEANGLRVTPAQAQRPARARLPRPPPPAPCSMRSIAYEAGGVRAAWCEESAWRSVVVVAAFRMRPLRRAVLGDVVVDVGRGVRLLPGRRLVLLQQCHLMLLLIEIALVRLPRGRQRRLVLLDRRGIRRRPLARVRELGLQRVDTGLSRLRLRAILRKCRLSR